MVTAVSRFTEQVGSMIKGIPKHNCTSEVSDALRQHSQFTTWYYLHLSHSDSKFKVHITSFKKIILWNITHAYSTQPPFLSCSFKRSELVAVGSEKEPWYGRTVGWGDTGRHPTLQGVLWAGLGLAWVTETNPGRRPNRYWWTDLGRHKGRREWPRYFS